MSNLDASFLTQINMFDVFCLSLTRMHKHTVFPFVWGVDFHVGQKFPTNGWRKFFNPISESDMSLNM